MEIRENFYNLEEWIAYRELHPTLVRQDDIVQMGTRIIVEGFSEPLTLRQAPPGAAKHIGSYREGLIYEGISSRVRAVMLTIAEMYDTTDIYRYRMYATEGLTTFALRMRGMFPRFIGSEYTEEADKRAWLSPVPFENLLNLTFSNNSFDLVSTNEVLEHVPSIDAAFAEIYRVLTPGGWHIGTCPFYAMQQDSVIRAKLARGKVIHLMEPEYHGNPMSAQGSLVFEIPGWNILSRIKAAGFSNAYMRFVVSEKHGCLDETSTGIFVLCCQK